MRAKEGGGLGRRAREEDQGGREEGGRGQGVRALGSEGGWRARESQESEFLASEQNMTKLRI